MELDRRQTMIWTGATFAVLLLLLFVRISSFGIWDPWELNAADVARDMMEGDAVEFRRGPLASWLMSSSFRIFGVHEWSGRAPIALGGLLTIVVAWLLAARFGGRRAAIFAAVVAGTTPLFLLNARQMLGDALAFGTSGLVALTAASAAWKPSSARNDALRMRHLSLWLVGFVVATVLATLASGTLLGVLPPLGAVALVTALRGSLPRDPAERVGSIAIMVAGAGVLFAVAQAVIADAANYSPILGGAPQGGDPPTFDAAMELVFHGLAPWSALGLLACVRMLSPREDDQLETSASNLRMAMVLWLAFGYGALTLYTARYGPATFIPVVAVAAVVAFFLRDVEESDRPWWAEAIVAALFVGLLIRDFALYPESPVRGLPIENLTVPEVFNPRRWWSLVLAFFALSLLLAFGTRTDGEAPDLKAPYRWMRTQWTLGGAHRFWLGLAAFLAGGFLIFGVVCVVAGDSLPFPSIVPRVGRYLTLVPIVAAIGIAGVPWTFYLFGKLRSYRMLVVLGAGLVVGAYASQGFLPSLSSHFSPREVYDTYNELGAGEPLAEFRVNGRAAAYYARGETVDIDTQNELLDWLDNEEQRWAVVPADELPALNRAWRSREGEHLFIADARSARVVLATNHTVNGRENENFIAGAVVDEVPELDQTVGANFDDKIELVGYNLELPQDGYIGAGQTMVVTWYWRCLQRVGGAYKIFLHVDGAGNRLNGDHEPVEERYPVRLWDEGDIVVDRQELTVPANYRPGIYTFYIGFFSGNNRLGVSPESLDDGADRARAGRIRVR
ncbi:MAG: glycosyltransferase family 39 protein [Myxococcota bacterium]